MPDAQRNSGTAGVRYEDVTQDGSLKVCSIPHSIGIVCFRDLWYDHPIQVEHRPKGVVPILSRLVLESLESPISVRNALECSGQFSLGTVRDGAGEVSRLVMNMDATLSAPCDRTHGVPPASNALIPCGRIHAEHVFTRPLGRAVERRVTRLELDGVPCIPDAPISHARYGELLTMPEGCEVVDAEWFRDGLDAAFGVVHTDSNQHVNSLVYPTLFEEAMLRRMIGCGAGTSNALLEHVDVAFRKPLFAGDTARLSLRAFRLGAQWGAIAYLAPEGVPPEKANATCRMLMRA